MTVIHREYGECKMSGDGFSSQRMRYSLAVYRDAHGNKRADGRLDGPSSVLRQAALTDKFVSIELKDGGIIMAHISNVQSNGPTAHAKFIVSGPVPGIAA
jgi:hypothetical protein